MSINSFTNRFIVIRSLRARVLNKYAYYLNLLRFDTVTDGLKALYKNITVSTKALPKLSNKAETLEYIIDLITTLYKKDGT